MTKDELIKQFGGKELGFRKVFKMKNFRICLMSWHSVFSLKRFYVQDAVIYGNTHWKGKRISLGFFIIEITKKVNRQDI
jgi:hypothetical protein